MIYTNPNPNLKKILLVGAAFVIAALLIIVLPLWLRNYNSSTSSLNPTKNSLQQQKIQKEQDKLIEMAKKQKDSVLSPEQIQKEQDRLIEESKANGSGKSPEELQKDQSSLIEATKK